MDELFTCRNCVHNCGQSLTIGQGTGFCIKHDSVIRVPHRTTCKYLHRKDLPYFVVDEGLREHAAEFAGFARLVTLDTKEPIEQIRYSEKFNWERKTFDAVVHSVAQYHKLKKKWVLISAFTSGVDGRRSLAHSSLIRHYMDHCGTWTSSYRLVLGLLQEFAVEPRFDAGELMVTAGMTAEATAEEALWDVVLVRLSALQEYGWHAGLEPLMWASDSLNGELAELNWPRLRHAFSRLRGDWIDMIIQHAMEHHAFFPPVDPDFREEFEEED
jgi:hypothetical protein